MSEWKSIRNGCEFVSGFAFKGTDFNDERYGVPIIKIKNIQNDFVTIDVSQYIEDGILNQNYKNIEKYYVEDNEVLISMTGAGSVGRVGLTCFKGFALLNQRVGKFIPDEKNLNKEYLYHILTSEYFQRLLFNKGQGSGQPNLSPDEILDVAIPWPAYKEQVVIGSALHNLTKKITLLRQQNQNLEELAQTLFKRWFVEFEFPNENGEPYKSSGGKMVESELGEIPEGWKVSTIGENIETIGGGTPSTTESVFWEDGEVLWYSPTDLTKENSMFSNGSAKRITELGLQKSAAKLFPAYSLLMTSRATVGEITINTQRACTNQGFITLIPNDNLSIYFLYNWLKSKLKTVHNLASGSTFPEISKSDFRNIEVLLATNDVHSKFDNTVIPIFKSIENNTQEILTLTQLRDTLLPKLMSGDLRVMH